MKISHPFPGVVVSSLILLAALGAAEVQFVLPPETAAFKMKPGVELALANCAICHSADYISTQPSLNRAQWTASVQKMQQKYGAPIATNQVDRLVDYLVKNYGSESASSGK
jgi:sulfite dehydrogenase